MRLLFASLLLSIAALAQSPYLKWLNEDVKYLILDDERQRFLTLTADAERQAFIEQFWLRRDPTPGTAQNEVKEEHYRRIAYANERFASANPGWMTDRGRVYITFGPPDEVESYPSRQGQNPPREIWRYGHIKGVGDRVTLEFVDPDLKGEYRLLGSAR